MSKYKLMPEEATPEMEQAAEKYWNDRKFKALSDDPRTWKGLYAAMRAAAPAVQGELVVCATCKGEGSRVAPLDIILTCPGCEGSGKCLPLQPAEQQPTISDEIPARTTFGGPQRFTTAGQHPAEQQPDVAHLVEALEECAASLAWNCFGECRAIHAGPIMPAAMALDTARAALAPYRKQETSHDNP